METALLIVRTSPWSRLLRLFVTRCAVLGIMYGAGTSIYAAFHFSVGVGGFLVMMLAIAYVGFEGAVIGFALWVLWTAYLLTREWLACRCSRRPTPPQ